MSSLPAWCVCSHDAPPKEGQSTKNSGLKSEAGEGSGGEEERIDILKDKYSLGKSQSSRQTNSSGNDVDRKKLETKGIIKWCSSRVLCVCFAN